ncbi:MAG: hypothetical protein A3F09_00775 [Chlamydiae bacterium RIFCSPHIGHO2_12_FULL_49_11]|nr:MAG: hypothetical protein A3F09_00775 [Chlamydiae bacterium RIFCSPHIGHO2_12_FULL_49_11]
MNWTRLHYGFAVCLTLSFASLGAATESKADLETCEHCAMSLSRAFIAVAKKTRPSVVHIRAEMGQTANGFQFNDPNSPFEQFQDELFHKFFGFPSPQERAPHDTPRQVASGSGFLVSPDGYIVTNYHVVKDATKIVIERYEEENIELEAQLIGIDPNTDIAVLKIAGENFPCLEFGDSDEVQVGEWMLAIGHPFRLRDSVSAGVVSATHRGNLQISQLEDFIQTDASVNPGHSGGPLLNLSSKVVGVNTAILTQSGASHGVSFSVPSNIARMVYEQIRENGSVDRAFLGAYIQDLDENLIEAFHLKKGTSGALIAEIMTDSAAERGGLLRGDIVTHINGQPIRSGKALRLAIMKLPSGSLCKISLLREGKSLQLEVKLGTQAKQVSIEGDAIFRLGITVEQLTPENTHKYRLKTDDQGLVITKVVPNSIAAIAGWHVNDVILVVNGQKMLTIDNLKAVLEKSVSNEKLVFLIHHTQSGRAGFHGVPHPDAR